jgi:zinc protease
VNATRRGRAVWLLVVMLAGATAQGCELRPSRQFAPPTKLSAGPPVRLIGTDDAERELEPESPSPAPADWNDGNPQQVVIRRLQNGMMLHALPRSELPAATVLIVFGTKVIPSPLPTAEIYAAAAMRGRALPWSRQQADGARMFTVARNDFVAMGFTGLSSVIGTVLARLLPEMATASLWPADFDRAKEDLIGGLAGHEASRRAHATAFGGMFPGAHPYGSAAALLPEHFRKVMLGEVRALRDANLTTDNMLVAAAGNVDVASLASTLDRALVDVPRAPIVQVTPPEPRPSCAQEVIAVNDVGSQQTTVRLAYPAVPARHVDVAALEVLAAAVGGSISTHLNVSLRRGRGLSYGFAAELHKMRAGGVFSLQGDVDPSRSVEALSALHAEIDALMRTPLGEEDLRQAKISAAHRASRLGGVVTAIRLAEAAILGIPMSDTSAIKGVTAEQVRAAAERYLQPAKRCTVVVGDAPRLERDLRAAGLGPVSR